MEIKNKTKKKKNALFDGLDYQIPDIQLKGVRGRWRYASSKATVHNIAHPATAPPTSEWMVLFAQFLA